MRPVVFLDVDGVCANFAGRVVDEVNRLLGTRHTTDDVREWDICKSLDVPKDVAREVDRYISSPFFCFNLELYEGAREGVEEIREFAHVIAATTPWDSPTWMREREQWLCERLGFERRDVKFTHQKQYLDGAALVDDNRGHVKSWLLRHPGRAGITFRRPWNADEPGPNRDDEYVACDWKHLVALLKSVLTGTRATSRAVETGWLVEMVGASTPVWWTGRTWTEDSNEALRFARYVDADSYINQVPLRHPARATEHQWI